MIDRLDDWLNPIVVKELRQAVRSRVVVVILQILLVLQLLVMGVTAIQLNANQGNNSHEQAAGREVFMALHGILLGACMVLLPGYAAFRLGSERSENDVDLLFVSALRPGAIMRGKFLATAVLTLLIFSACAPFMTFCYLLRGIDIPTILFVLAIDFLTVLASTQIALFLASFPGNRGMKGALGIAGLFCLLWVFGITMAKTAEMVEFGRGPFWDSEEFWFTCGTVIFLVASGMGLLFCWSVAMISPPSSNRALPVRLYMTGLVLVNAVLAGSWSYFVNNSTPIWMWLWGTASLFCLYMLITINEREYWTLRVARTIPRQGLLRRFAFLFYSGSAGGMILSFLIIGTTIVAACLWTKFVLDSPPLKSSSFDYDTDSRVKIAATLLALYTYCYCMTAVCIRRLFGDRIKISYTWVVALLLVAAGCILPPVIGYLTFNDRWAGHQLSSERWLLIGNPYAVVAEISPLHFYHYFSNDYQDFAMVCLLFTGFWALAVTVLSLRWFFGQIERFEAPVQVAIPELKPADVA